ncbi:fumarylacetoacetate hydrolase family protein [Antrihabitans sp. YC2-6]|uniref:fumarylacetoacetate hydrolase family protein n=1 Tax=Antrihabitans sp. YC2-6 TaxID=2799498 RepID=UPI0018F511A7|nr:fumarylacetoacetate hydrolase family protein [Antrihabitans sp. YC2-6]MBJ8344319.1 fumarylacetoacetate hydrolase family protein [Antrihabitans sp. YC2-6]
MRLATVKVDNTRRAVFVDPKRGVLFADSVLPNFDGDVRDLVELDADDDVLALAARAHDDLFVPVDEMLFTAPYLRPRKIWGIGLNYRDHAGDLSESVPDEPASFIKGDHTIVGQDEPIELPPTTLSNRVTAEAEIGLIIGRTCRNVSEEDALDYVWGVTTILDQTAEDILRRNPRFLTRAKNFPNFFCFGPELVPMAEVRDTFPELGAIEVSTVRNDDEIRSNTVSNMTFSPRHLVSFHSQVMPLFPGDIISTGTPGALVVADGDRIECRIPGIGILRNTIKQG